MRILRQECHQEAKPNEDDEFVDHNILVLVTFHGRYLIFDLERLLLDKIEIEKLKSNRCRDY